MRHRTIGILLVGLIAAFGLTASLFNARVNRSAPENSEAAQTAAALSPESAPFSAVRCAARLCAADREAALHARRVRFTRLEQFLICAVSFALKPIYEVVSILIVIVIWRRPELHWRILRWGLLAFFLGENACAVNYLFFGLTSFAWEFWHCYGMLVATGFISYAALEFADQHLVHCGQEDRPCSFLDLCKRCYKHQPVACNAWLLMVFAIPATIILCFMPLAASFRNFSCIGTVFDSEILFAHPRLQQFYEVRVYPVLAMILFALSWIVLYAGRERGMRASRILFAAGLGPFGFSMLRFVLFWSYSDNILWAEVWEEITEFLLIAAILVLLNAKRINGWLRPASATNPQAQGCT